MPVLEELGVGGYGDGRCYLLELEKPDDLPAELKISSKYFVCLLTLGSVVVDRDIIRGFAKKIIDLGARSVSVFGGDCERVHDIFDDEFHNLFGIKNDSPVLMTTWHANEPIEEAIWYVLCCSSVDGVFAEECNSILAISVDSSPHAEAVRVAFSDPSEFVRQILSKKT